MEVLLANLTIDKINLKYYKVESNRKYGIKILKVEDDITEEAEILRITDKERDIEKLLDKLIKGNVTPVTLKDILEDFALEYIRRNLQVKLIAK